MLELANTKVICAVYGPNATEGRDYLDKGQLECTFRFTSFARRVRRDKRKELNGSAEEKALSLELAAALSARGCGLSLDCAARGCLPSTARRRGCRSRWRSTT